MSTPRSDRKKQFSVLERAGFEVEPPRYLAALAFPLSGGFVGKRFLPRRTPEAIFGVDDWIVRLFGRSLAWRYLLVANR
jgi:hypothetical protein